MAFGIYKQGQGYWVRVLTAVFAGVLVLSAGAWAWKQASLVRPPTPTWNVNVRSVLGDPGVGARARLVGTNPFTSEEDIVLGEARIVAVEPGRIVVGEIGMSAEGLNPSQAARLINVEGSAEFTARVLSAQGIPAFEPIFIQLAVMAVTIALGALIIYWFVAVNRRTVEFLIATDGEMKKVNWSTRKEVQGSTWVVVVACFLISAVLFCFDLVFAAFFKFVGVLEQTRF